MYTGARESKIGWGGARDRAVSFVVEHADPWTVRRGPGGIESDGNRAFIRGRVSGVYRITYVDQLMWSVRRRSSG